MKIKKKGIVKHSKNQIKCLYGIWDAVPSPKTTDNREYMISRRLNIISFLKSVINRSTFLNKMIYRIEISNSENLILSTEFGSLVYKRQKLNSIQSKK